ncbi:helix-turn-helix domain-containing protein [Thiomicrorhabdus xiamenensis]|uniref:Helix-turn-helix domain-containing protein n=1 Tax=Thiomicrorhabdus xiamenensis TaxID=2739063 RepID=A0A7D4NRD2_9GAMM|nr:helix-turn-helix domain-containing protein [Thiomicrorhabdus xiamenensis]QKI89490.1 helix-turn-helix domain-containing protein [Thiomicrorhabdus xiamenensis]
MHQEQNLLRPKRCILETNDLENQAEGLTNWQQEYDQISNGKFFGRIEKVESGGMHFFSEYTSHTLHQDCQIWQNAVWFGIPQLNQDICRINGQIIEQNAIACRNSKSSFELITPENFTIYGIVLEEKLLQRLSDKQGINLIENAHLGIQEQFRVNSEQNYLLQSILSRLTHPQDSQVDQRIPLDFLTNALLSALPQELSREYSCTPSYKQRKLVVDRVRDYLSQCRDDQPISMQELCEIACVSRRTLQYSFETILGCSPLKFLRALRLNQVRRKLKSSQEDETIADIASYWGFWHAGQFSRDYKLLFGESPSQTLAKAKKD